MGGDAKGQCTWNRWRNRGETVDSNRGGGDGRGTPRLEWCVSRGSELGKLCIPREVRGAKAACLKRKLTEVLGGAKES